MELATEGSAQQMPQSESVERIFNMRHRVSKREAKRKGEQLKERRRCRGKISLLIIVFSRKANIVVPNKNRMGMTPSVSAVVQV